MSLPRSVAGWTIAVFGLIALVLGVIGLVWPAALLGLLGFETLTPTERAPGDYTRTFAAASSMASLNMGVYYLVAAVTEWRPFYRFTVLFRLVTFMVFVTLVLTDVAPGRFMGVAVWEGLGAVATALGLVLDSHRSGGRSVRSVPSAAVPADSGR